ncbi:hypothetical protein HK103_002627 [Boothiomyces macroporosus]|uniref:NADPH oxidase regulator NoxR n=1 Tax=Boothiomyces macroporosus TaxID=261099 RepID=A0AAD5Y6Z9_9FUNG|nr:hypothetical protein HK103_002627 [Boothiomyces macroporosus]
MTSKEDLLLWIQGNDLYRAGDLKGALEALRHVGAYSKILFNIGMIYSRTDDFESAEIMYDQALNQDKYLAVAAFQKGFACSMQGKFYEAEECYRTVIELLLENEFIDYQQLGMDYKVYKCETLYNLGICCYQLEKDRESASFIDEARRTAKTSDQKTIIANSDSQTLFSVPFGSIFEVPDNKKKNLEKKEFITGGKLVLDSKPEDDAGFMGFTGAAMLDPTLEENSKFGTIVRKKEAPMDKLQRARSYSSPDISKSANNKAATPQRAATTSRVSQKSKMISSRKSSLPTSKFTYAETKATPATLFEEAAPTTRYQEPPKVIQGGDFRLKQYDQPSLSTSYNEREDNTQLIARQNFRLDQKEYTAIVSSYETPKSAPKPQSDYGADSGYEESQLGGEKIKIKIHSGQTNIALWFTTNSLLEEVQQKVQKKLNLFATPEFGYLDEEDQKTMISICDQEDFATFLEESGKNVHLYIREGFGDYLADIY